MSRLPSWALLEAWYASTGPAGAVVGVLGLMATSLSVWLLLASVLQVLRAVPGLSSLGTIADRFSPRPLQRFGCRLAGLSLTAGLAAAAPGAGTPAVVTPPTPLGVTTARAPADEVPPLAPAAPARPVWPTGTAVLRLVPDEPVAALPDHAAASDVTVEPGDSFWSLAVDALQDAAGVEPDERAVADYWQRLIERNRGVLLDPANPDLIYPGQVLTLPQI